MVEASQDSVTPAATTAAPVADTAVTPSATPVTTDTPVAVTSATSTEVAASSTPEVKPATETPSATESVLGDPKPSADAKPTEVKTETPAIEKKEASGDKPTETKADIPAETKIELPKYEDFKLPENLSIDKEPLDAFTKILGEIETGKLDHLGMQEKGQALIDLAAKNTVESINRLNDYYVQFHENQKKEWFNSFKADPEMGGDKLDATVGMLRDAVEQNAGTEAQLTELRTLMKETGVGNHPALTRLIYNMQQKINKFTTEGSDNRMVPGGRPAPSKVKDYQRFYTGGS